MTTAAAPVAEGLRERSKRRRVERILDAARELLREDPERIPTMERISTRAEVAPATIFNLVGTREQLWATLMDATLAQLERLLAQLPDEPDPHARARRIAVTTAEVMCADRFVHRMVVAHWSESARFLRRDPLPAIVACLDDAAAAGALRPGLDHKRLVETFRAAATGALHLWAAGMIDDRGFRARCATALDCVFAAAAADPETAVAYLGA